MTEIITQVVALCGLITGVAAVIGLIVQMVKKAKSPSALQNQRIAACETRLARIESNLAKDLDRFEDIESGTVVIMTSILALLSHNIDGNDVQAMREAREELQAYLIRSKVKKKGDSL